MRLSEGVEWAIHCCTILAAVPEGKALPATRLAEFHGVPPAYLAKHLQSLAGAGIVQSVAGRRGGYRLARPPAEVSLLDVVDAVEGGEPTFRCTEIRQRGPAALPQHRYRKPCGIARAMWAAEQAWRAALSAHTIEDVLVGVAVDVPAQAIAKGAAWMKEALA